MNSAEPGHRYRRYAAGRCHICDTCGTAKHSNGWYWFAGHKSQQEPPCALYTPAMDEWKQQAIEVPL